MASTLTPSCIPPQLHTQVSFSYPSLGPGIYMIDMTSDSTCTEQGQGQEVHTMNMNNIQQVIDSCSDENWKDILNDPRSKSSLDKSIRSIEITLDMSGSYFRGVNGEQISLEYFNEGFKCRFNPSSEGSAYGDGMARFTLRINFPGKLGTKGSEKSDFQ